MRGLARMKAQVVRYLTHCLAPKGAGWVMVHAKFDDIQICAPSRRSISSILGVGGLDDQNSEHRSRLSFR
jgi:hypothetical protein